MRIDAIPIGKNPPDDINVIIEVPVGGEPIKYELDKASGTLWVDRFLYTPMRYPVNYGFVPHTLSEDGDPIDVMIASTRPIIPGAVMQARPIGAGKNLAQGPVIVRRTGVANAIAPVLILHRCEIGGKRLYLDPGEALRL